MQMAHYKLTIIIIIVIVIVIVIVIIIIYVVSRTFTMGELSNINRLLCYFFILILFSYSSHLISKIIEGSFE